MTPPASTHCVTDETSPAPPRTPAEEQEIVSSPKPESQPSSPEPKATPETARSEMDPSADTEMKD